MPAGMQASTAKTSSKSSRGEGKQRHPGQPGPGAYDPKSSKDIQTGAAAAGTSAFRSTSKARDSAQPDHLGPGKYDPHHSVVDAGKSFGYQSKGAAKRFGGQKAKKGAFGGHSKRELHMEILGEGGVE